VKKCIMPSFLRVSGTRLVDEAGQEIILRGAGLGGWMNMENFITGRFLNIVF
jgi:hypothetical protein